MHVRVLEVLGMLRVFGAGQQGVDGLCRAIDQVLELLVRSRDRRIVNVRVFQMLQLFRSNFVERVRPQQSGDGQILKTEPLVGGVLGELDSSVVAPHVGALLARLEDADRHVRYCAEHALGRIVQHRGGSYTILIE